MVKAKEFKIATLQFSIFTPFLNFHKSKILNLFISKFDDLFNGDTITLPVPSNPPQDYPQIILSSEDKKYKLDIAPTRINLFRNLGEDEESIESNSFFKNGLALFKEYLDLTNAKAGRLAIITSKYIEKDNPGLILAKHFCNKNMLIEPFNRPENFEIHSHKKYVLSDFNINSWVRCKTSSLVRNKQPIILVAQDINTLHEEIEKNDFNFSQIKLFSEIIAVEQFSILSKYFPNNESN